MQKCCSANHSYCCTRNYDETWVVFGWTPALQLIYCIRGIFRGGLIFANHLSQKFSLWFMSICTSESTTKIAKLSSRELNICTNLGQIRENICTRKYWRRYSSLPNDIAKLYVARRDVKLCWKFDIFFDNAGASPDTRLHSALQLDRPTVTSRLGVASPVTRLHSALQLDRPTVTSGLGVAHVTPHPSHASSCGVALSHGN